MNTHESGGADQPEADKNLQDARRVRRLEEIRELDVRLQGRQ